MPYRSHQQSSLTSCAPKWSTFVEEEVWEYVVRSTDWRPHGDFSQSKEKHRTRTCLRSNAVIKRNEWKSKTPFLASVLVSLQSYMKEARSHQVWNIQWPIQTLKLKFQAMQGAQKQNKKAKLLGKRKRQERTQKKLPRSLKWFRTPEQYRRDQEILENAEPVELPEWWKRRYRKLLQDL